MTDRFHLRQCAARIKDWQTALALVAVLLVGDRLFDLRSPLADDEQQRRSYEQVLFEQDLQLIPGISARSRVVTTPQGLRGELFESDTRNVLLMGGSTVYCRFLDEGRTLTATVANAVPAPIRKALALRVATSARAGQSARHSVVNLQRLIEQENTRPVLVVAQLGSNDMVKFLQSAPWSDAWGAGGAHASPDGSFVGKRREQLFRDAKKPARQTQHLLRLRAAYRQHAKVLRLPAELETAYRASLERFASELERLYSVADQADVPLVLLTQAINLNAVGNSEEELPFALFYPPTGEGFVPGPELLVELLAGFNEVTRTVAARNEIPLLDMASLLSRCEDCFYDQWHLTLKGANESGVRIAEFLRAEGLLQVE